MRIICHGYLKKGVLGSSNRPPKTHHGGGRIGTWKNDLKSATPFCSRKYDLRSFWNKRHKEATSYYNRKSGGNISKSPKMSFLNFQILTMMESCFVMLFFKKERYWLKRWVFCTSKTLLIIGKIPVNKMIMYIDHTEREMTSKHDFFFLSIK